MIDQPYDSLPAKGKAHTTTDLKVHYKMNDDAANNFVVEEILAFDGSLLDSGGSPYDTDLVSTSGQVNDCLDLVGGEYIDVSAALNLDYVSFAAWVNPFNAPNNSYIASETLRFDVRLHVDTVIFNVFTTQTGINWGLISDSNANIGAGLWTHVACTFDGYNMKIYVNGSLIKERTIDYVDTIKTVGGGGDLALGIRTSFYDKPLEGKIDDVRIYDAGINAEEVMAIYNEGNGTEDNNSFVTGSVAGSWLNKRTVGGEDYSDNGNDGTATDVVFGDVGGEFNGSSSTIDMGNVLNQTTGNITMSAWVKRNNTALTEVILSKKLTHSGTGDTGYAFYFSNLNLVTLLAGTSDRSYLGGTTDIVAGEWVHCVGIVDITNDLHTLVVNGEVLISAAGSNLLSTIGSVSNSQGFRIGADDTPSDYFDGEIRDARIYNEAKSTDWAAHEYNKGVPDDSLVLHVDDQAKDLSRYDHAISIVGTGVILGKEIDMINTTSALSAPANTAYSASPNGIITAMCWTRLANNNTHSYFGTDNNSQGWSFKSGSGRKLALTVRYSGTDLNFVSTDVVPTAIWKHVAVVYQNDTCVFYINGEEVSGYDTTTDGVGTINNDTGLVMGVGCRNGGTSNEVKKMKDARVYNEAKSADFIKNEYLRTKGEY